MPNTITPLERFGDKIANDYALTPTNIYPAPRGFAAETYFVDTEDQSYFLKIMNNARRQSMFKHGLRVTDTLVKEGLNYIPRILKTTSDDLFVEIDGAVCALFTRLHAEHSFHYNREDVFKKLANIYQISETFSEKDSFLKETFRDWFIEDYKKELNSFLTSDGKTEEALEVREFIEPYREFLNRLPSLASACVKQSKEQNATFYLTHSDYTNNVLISDSGEQYLIDFDEAMFGPLERDGWLTIAAENEESKLWLKVIREYFPDYQVNPIFIRYYIYERFMIDLISFLQELVHNQDKAYRKKIVISTRDYLFGWLYPIMMKHST